MATNRVIPTKRRFSIMARDGFRCVYCGASSQSGATLEVDHVIPVAQGGSDENSNLATACWACNNGKRDRTVEEAAADADCGIGATCVTPLLIASKAAFLNMGTRTVRRYLEEAGAILPPPRPHHAAIKPSEENVWYIADMLDRALAD